MPAASSAAMISRRPEVARWEGKKPRLPTSTPMVICLGISIDSLRLLAAAEHIKIKHDGHGQKRRPQTPNLITRGAFIEVRGVERTGNRGYVLFLSPGRGRKRSV